MFSGTTLYESYLGTFWNVIFTLLPIIFFGVFDQDVPEIISERFPHVYVDGQRQRGFNSDKMVIWVVNAI